MNDSANRTQIGIDVAVLAPSEPGQPRRLLSIGEVPWGQVMTSQHSAAGFSADLRSATDPRLLLVSAGDLYR